MNWISILLLYVLNIQSKKDPIKIQKTIFLINDNWLANEETIKSNKGYLYKIDVNVERDSGVTDGFRYYPKRCYSFKSTNFGYIVIPRCWMIVKDIESFIESNEVDDFFLKFHFVLTHESIDVSHCNVARYEEKFKNYFVTYKLPEKTPENKKNINLRCDVSTNLRFKHINKRFEELIEMNLLKLNENIEKIDENKKKENITSKTEDDLDFDLYYFENYSKCLESLEKFIRKLCYFKLVKDDDDVSDLSFSISFTSDPSILNLSSDLSSISSNSDSSILNLSNSNSSTLNLSNSDSSTLNLSNSDSSNLNLSNSDSSKTPETSNSSISEPSESFESFNSSFFESFGSSECLEFLGIYTDSTSTLKVSQFIKKFREKDGRTIDKMTFLYINCYLFIIDEILKNNIFLPIGDKYDIDFYIEQLFNFVIELENDNEQEIFNSNFEDEVFLPPKLKDSLTNKLKDLQTKVLKNICESNYVLNCFSKFLNEEINTLDDYIKVEKMICDFYNMFVHIVYSYNKSNNKLSLPCSYVSPISNGDYSIKIVDGIRIKFGFPAKFGKIRGLDDNKEEVYMEEDIDYFIDKSGALCCLSEVFRSKNIQKIEILSSDAKNYKKIKISDYLST